MVGIVVPHIVEESRKVVQVVLQDRVRQRTFEEITDVLRPRVVKESAEVTMRIAERFVEWHGGFFSVGGR